MTDTTQEAEHKAFLQFLTESCQETTEIKLFIAPDIRQNWSIDPPGILQKWSSIPKQGLQRKPSRVFLKDLEENILSLL